MKVDAWTRLNCLLSFRVFPPCYLARANLAFRLTGCLIFVPVDMRCIVLSPYFVNSLPQARGRCLCVYSLFVCAFPYLSFIYALFFSFTPYLPALFIVPCMGRPHHLPCLNRVNIYDFPICRLSVLGTSAFRPFPVFLPASMLLFSFPSRA